MSTCCSTSVDVNIDDLYYSHFLPGHPLQEPLFASLLPRQVKSRNSRKACQVLDTAFGSPPELSSLNKA